MTPDPFLAQIRDAAKQWDALSPEQQAEIERQHEARHAERMKQMWAEFEADVAANRARREAERG